MISFFLGIILGFLVAILILATTFFTVTKTKDKIIRQVTQLETIVKRKEPISIIKRKSEAEEAMEHVLSLNVDRGGIPDSELK